MPKYTNNFQGQSFVQETIENEDGIVGTIRLKPSSVMWKPKGGRKFYTVPLARFTDWIENDAGASRTKS